jgi:ribosomal protein S6--L-glutamate ligase
MSGGGRQAVALEGRLRNCSNVKTLGVRPNFSDYTPYEAGLIQRAEKVYYPSTHYADMLAAMGKKIFPSVHTYRFVQDKIKQSILFQMSDIPLPRTRFFWGGKKANKILEYFHFPFVAKIARGSALGAGVYLIRSRAELDRYCRAEKVAYIQEYIETDRDLRVVVIGERVRHAYWRIGRDGEFRTNLGRGGRIETRGVPEEGVELARETAMRCGWDDVGIDICYSEGRPYVLEANMKYGKQGFRAAGIDYTALMEELIRNGEI